MKETKALDSQTWNRSMRKTLTLLTAAVALFAFSFMFSSCKNCNGNKGRDNGNSDDNPNGGNGQNQDNPAEDGDKGDQAKVASEDEIKATMKIATEDFGSDVTDINHIGHIVYDDIHYYYRDHNNRSHNGQSGSGNCGLYAMKRLLFVLGKYKLVEEDLWYKYTDVELREKIVRITGAEKYKCQSEIIGAPILRTLMRDIFKVPVKYNEIYDRSDQPIESGFMPPLLSPDETDAHEVETERKATEFETAAKAAQIQAETAKGNMKTIRMAMTEINRVAEEVTALRNKTAISGIYGSEKFTVKEILRIMTAQNAVEETKKKVQNIARMAEAN
jgi:hypothetical protein